MGALGGGNSYYEVLGVNLHPINPGRLSDQCHTGAGRCAPMLPR